MSRESLAAKGLEICILGDPGADSGDEEKSKRAEKYMARRKVKNGEKSPWGQCLTRPVPNSRRRSGFFITVFCELPGRSSMDGFFPTKPKNTKTDQNGL